MSARPFNPDDPDQLARLEQSIAKLPAREREIFEAVRFEGLSYADIAARAGLSALEVERRMSRALATLDRELARPRRPWWHWW